MKMRDAFQHLTIRQDAENFTGVYSTPDERCGYALCLACFRQRWD